MPELPEVETVARGLRQRIVGKQIASVDVFDSNKFTGSAKQLRDFVYDRAVSGIGRRGKWLVLELDTGYGFMIHLKMTGQLLYDDGTPQFLGGHTMNSDKPAYPNSHTRVVFHFSDDTRLYFQDMRRFGYVKLLSAPRLERYFAEKDLGPEPLDPEFTFKYFDAVCKRRGNTTVKALLLNQQAIAGIGNIYVDDSCWVAGVRPTRRVKSLTKAERVKLYEAIKLIIAEAIELGGTSFSAYYRVDGTVGEYWSQRKAYGRTNEPCLRCQTPLKKTRVAGRGTHYCPSCQK